MSINYINTGTAPNAGNGDSLRTAFNKINANFSYLGTATVGPTGPVGPGVPAGGLAGQVLAKIDGSDYNTYWVDQTGGGGSTGIGNSSILALNVNITSNATVNAGVNGFSVGPVNTANGVVVTITSGSRWVII